MNILIDRLPTTVKIGGSDVQIDSNFRASILFELMMQDDDVPKDRKLPMALSLYYPEMPPVNLLSEAVEALLWFYRGGEEERTSKKASQNNTAGDDEQEDEESTKKNKIYSFEYDDKYIYSAFLSQYNIDLQSTKYLHWWKFKALFTSLDESCQFCKIMSYRGMKISNKMTKEQKAYYRRMKKVYALPESQAEQDRQEAITQALLNGGDLTGLL